MASKDPTEYVYLEEVKKQTIPGGTKKIGMFFPEELTLIRNKAHYLYDPRSEYEFDENMVKGIMEIGLSKSVDCQKIKMDDGTCILAVTDGRQGVINTIEANRRLVEEGKPPIRVKVEVREEDEVTAVRRMVMGNNHRKDDDPVVKGIKAKKMKEMGMPVELICQDFDCVPETLNNWINLTKLCAHVQKLVQTNHIAMTTALKLRDLSPTEQRAEADKIVAGVKRSSRGAGNEHKGVDKRRIKRIHELSGGRNDAVKKMFDWFVGNCSDADVADLIDFSVLEKGNANGTGEDGGTGGNGKKRGRKKASKNADEMDDADQDKTLSEIFGGAKPFIDLNDDSDGDGLNDDDLDRLTDDDRAGDDD